MLRERVHYALAGAVVVVLGLIWRSHLLPLSPFVKKYGADALWALLVFLLIRFIQPRSKIWVGALTAVAFSAAVEFSQLYHASWIDAIRETRLGALVLGSVFNWPDIPAYVVGVMVGVIVERLALDRAGVI